MTKLEAGTRYALLVYDIPSKVYIPNPSALLRRWGARVNKSCWVLPTANVALVPLKEWVEKGAIVEVVEFGEHEVEKVVAIARRAITGEVESMQRFVGTLVAKVRARFAKASALPTGSPERAEAMKDADQYVYAALYRAKGVADAAEEAALHFAITGEVAALVEALRKSIKAQSATFYAIKQKAEGQARLEVAS
jgi:hypothetical protein